jgi:hypothetical protein
MLISSVPLTDIIVYAKQFERVNCIKESIYLMQLYSRHTSPPVYTER